MTSNSTAASVTESNDSKHSMNFYHNILDDTCALDVNTLVQRGTRFKDEDKKTFESIMKRVNTSVSNVEEDGVPINSE